jgi:uncharacterized membrane protein
MKCPKCQREIESTASFCIFCGTPLPSEVRRPPTPAQRPAEAPSQQTKELQEEVHRLRELIILMNDRLAALERLQGIAVPTPEPMAAPPVTEVPEAVPTMEPTPAAVAPSMEAVPSPAEEIAPAAPILPPPPREVVPRKPREWELILGGNWLARVGVIALIIGAGFFLKFAFDQNWLGPTARVILGIVAGLGMVGGGYYWRKRYPTLSQALNGGGIAVLYLSIFAAFAFFQMLHFYVAIGLLFVVSGGSATLALRHNSMALAIIGIFGAFSAPFVLGGSAQGETALQGGLGIPLLAYIMVIDIGVLALSTFRNWRWFTLIAIVGSLVSFGIWHGQYGHKASLLTSELSLTIIFLIFVGATTLYHLIWRRLVQGFDYALIVINATAYFGISYGLMWEDLRVWMGGFTLLLALFYGGLAYVALRRGAENIRLGFFALGIAIVFLTIAIPVQLGDRAWTTIAWAVQGTVLMWLAIKFRMSQFRYYSYAVFAVTAIRLLSFDTSVDMRTFQPVVNERVLAFVFGIAAMYLTSYLLWQEKEAAPEAKAPRNAYPAFLVAGNLFSLWLVGAEIISYKASPLVYRGSLPLVLLIVFAGAMTLYHLVWRRPSRIFDLVLIAINAAFYLGISTALWGDFRVWMGGLYLVLAIFYGALAYFALRGGAQNYRFGLFALGIALVFVTLAVPVQFGDRVWTTITWAAELVILMWLSFRLKIPLFRAFSYGVFVLMAGRLLFFETGIDMRTFHPILNERFLAFFVSIAATYLVVYLLWRARETMREWATPASTFLVAANFFTLWVLSFEVWNYFDSQLATVSIQTAQTALRSFQNLSLTALWAFYAVVLLVIGIVRRWRLVRLWGLGLFIVPIGKVFIYDVWALETIYRIIAFVGLGLLLLASAYLYQRYSKAIRHFIVEK